jgi:hypothetical protein
MGSSSGSSSRITTSSSRPGAVGADDEISTVSWDHSYGVSDGVLHVFVEDAVLASAVGDLHHDKVALSQCRVKVTLSVGVSVGVGHCDDIERCAARLQRTLSACAPPSAYATPGVPAERSLRQRKSGRPLSRV